MKINPNSPATERNDVNGYGSVFCGVNGRGEDMWSSNSGEGLTIRHKAVFDIVAALISNTYWVEMHIGEVVKRAINIVDETFRQLNNEQEKG